MKVLLILLACLTGVLNTFGFPQGDAEVAAKNEIPQKSLSVSEQNKQIVLDFYKEVFGDKNVDAIDKYIDAGPENYIQHNPWVSNGREPLKEAARKWFEAGPWDAEILRSAAEGDLVFLHVKTSSTYLKSTLGNEVAAIVDVIRLKNGKFVEHWNIIQPVPATAANRVF